MKKIISALLLILTFCFFSMCTTTESEVLTEDNSEQIVATEEIVTLMYDGATDEPVLNTEPGTAESCGGILFEVFTLQEPDINGCCKLVLNIVSKEKQPIEVYVDGAFYGGGASFGASYLIRLCGVPKFVQVYSEGILCYSRVLVCKERCCDIVDYTIESSLVDGCCVFKFTVLRNDVDCTGFQYGLTNKGSVQTDFEVINGNPTFTAYLCDSDDEVRFYIVDNATGQRCQATRWFDSNSCKS
jgi:hypothetical protein